MKMFCITLEPNHYETIKKFGYTPVGLGKKDFNISWFTDKSKINISKKNKNYGEYTFHYWLWKNYLDKINDEWIGFCQYRKFWSFKNKNLFPNSLEELEETVIKEVPSDYDDFEVLLGEESSVANLKAMKFLKRGLKLLIKKPSYTFNLFSKKKRNIKFHFDMWHGSIYLEKAIELLDSENKKDFNDFVINSSSFNPHNMFICKSKKKLQEYYSVIFPWLKRCEDEFGFGNLKGYGETRIYGFLAERFMSYWFQKNSKFKTIPIVFYDIRKHSF